MWGTVPGVIMISDDCHCLFLRVPESGGVGKKDSLAKGYPTGPCKGILVTLW